MYTHLTEIEADYRRDRLTEQVRSGQRRYRRTPVAYSDRRSHAGRRHAA